VETPDPSPGVRPVPESLSPEERVEAGRSVYNANCIACHSLDPSEDGALGPAVAGSSLALLDARVLRAEYPEGYEPKRKTRVMVALPHLEPRLPELAAYLESFD
jgi:mono/diheme cytochrome c family protein